MKKNNNQLKNKISAIVYIICMFVVLVGLCSGCALTNKEKNNDGQNNVEKVKGSNIVQVGVNEDYVMMLDNKGNLHFYGEYTYGLKNTEEPKVVANNVKYFVQGGSQGGSLIIVKNDNTAYYSGLSIDGWGTTSDFEKVTDNVKNISSNSFCFFIVDNNDNYIVRGPVKNSSTMKYCNLPETYDGNFSLVSTNVKGGGFNWTFNIGYITNDGELYVSSFTKPGYKKILSNVKKVAGPLILTEDNTLYIFDEESEEITKKIDENVSEIYDISSLYYLYKKSDNKYYSIYADYENSIKELTFPNIKSPYYYNGKKLVYLNTNNKLVLAGEVDKYELDLSTETIKKTYDFLQQ